MKTVVITHKLLAHLYHVMDSYPVLVTTSEWLREVYHGEMYICVGSNCDYAIDFEDEKYYTYFMMIYHDYI